MLSSYRHKDVESLLYNYTKHQGVGDANAKNQDGVVVMVWIAIVFLGLVIIQTIIYIKNRFRHIEYLIDLSKYDTLRVHEEINPKIEQDIHKALFTEKVLFIGIGGGGCNIIENIKMFDSQHKFIMLNSDLQALNQCNLKNKVLLQSYKDDGLGCGGNEFCGMQSFGKEEKRKLLDLLDKNETAYVVITLGGGIGSGAGVEVVKYLDSIGIQVHVGVVFPFAFEGKNRMKKANNALKKIKAITDKVIVIQNENPKSKKLSIKNYFNSISFNIYEALAQNY